jgi:hypothetical protein
MLRDIKILSDAQDVPGLLSFLGAYLVQDRDQVGVSSRALPRTQSARCQPYSSQRVSLVSSADSCLLRGHCAVARVPCCTTKAVFGCPAAATCRWLWCWSTWMGARWQMC